MQIAPSRLELERLAEELSRVTGARVVVEPRLGSRRASAALAAATACAVMDAMALLTSARWFRVRGVYVLATDPRLAEVSLLTEEERAARKHEVFNRLVDSLTPDQVGTLEETGQLPLHSRTATPQQLRELQGLGALLCVDLSRPPSPEALQGAGFSLRVIPVYLTERDSMHPALELNAPGTANGFLIGLSTGWPPSR
jgi:hypothetical protein